MVLTAAIDESEGISGAYCLAAHFSTQEKWDDFSVEWREYLPLSSLQDDGSFRFKMSEMHISPDRTSRVKWFERIIGRHILFSIAVVFSKADLADIRASMFLPGVPIDFGYLKLPYLFALKAMLDTYFSRRGEFRKMALDHGVDLPLDERVRFVFDQNNDKAQFIKEWDHYYKSLSADAKSVLSGPPEFLDDTDFLPLQAADALAWSTRMLHEGKEVDFVPIARFEAEKHTPLFVVSWNKEQLRRDVVRTVRALLGDDRIVYWIKRVDVSN